VEAILEFYTFISNSASYHAMYLLHRAPLFFFKQIMVSIDLRSLIYITAHIWKLVITTISHNTYYITLSSTKPSRNSWAVKCFFARITSRSKKKTIVQILANIYNDIDYERWITFGTYYTTFACIYIFYISEWTDTLKKYAKDIHEIEMKKIHAEDKHKQTDMCIVQD